MVLDAVIALAYQFGYLGIFLAALIGSASIIFPLPASLITFTFGALLNPLLVGLAAGVGSAIGELTAYAAGFAGAKVFKKKRREQKSVFAALKRWFSSRRAFLVIVVFSFVPFAFDIVGLFCGAVRYNIKKFFLATLIGKILVNLLIAYAGYYGLTVLAGWLF